MGRRGRYTEEQVRNAVGTARSIAGALRLLGLSPAGGNHLTLKKLIERYALSTEHFDPYWAQHQPRPSRAIPLEQVLVENSTYHRHHLKRRSPACGVRSAGPRQPRPERRKVERPSYEQLMVDVQSMSFVAIGRKYGVSDNAVRKWIRWYEYERGDRDANDDEIAEGHAA